MTVDGKTGVRTIVGFERTYRAVDHIAQRNYGKSAEDLMKDKIPDEVIRTAKKEIAQEVKEGKISTEDIDERLFENHLYTKDLPPVDLLIRTSGEVRISNFLLWQLAYAELQFLDIFWPDFQEEHLYQCIINYQNKERRFGKTSEQITN